MIDLAARIKAASLPQDTVPVCLDGKLVGPFLAAVQASDLARIDALAKAVADASDDWLLTGLSAPAYTSLVATHPPRPGNEHDGARGFNIDTFPTALVRACVTDPAIDDDTWTELEPLLSSGYFDALFSVAVGLSKGTVDAGPFLPSSAATEPSTPTSKRRAS